MTRSQNRSGSQATRPMDNAARERIYLRQNGSPRLTARQSRRLRHKGHASKWLPALP